MNYNSLLADIVSRINMGNRHRVRTVYLNYNKIALNLVFLLVELGLLRGIKIKSNNIIWLNLRFKGGFHIFYKLSLVSKPSKRVYWNLRRLFLEVDKNNNNIYIITTKEGLLLGSDCLWRSLTGEILVKIIL
jgi:ribosomal protein S8